MYWRWPWLLWGLWGGVAFVSAGCTHALSPGARQQIADYPPSRHYDYRWPLRPFRWGHHAWSHFRETP